MTATETKVASNTTWFTTALIIQKIISFGYFTYLARVLPVADLGIYIFALSYIAIFSIIVDFGLANLITREIAKEPDSSQKLYSNVLTFRILSSVVAIIVALLVLHLLNYPVFTRELVYLALFLMLIESLVLTTYAVLRGFHNLKYESIGTIGVQFLIAILGVTTLQLTKDVRFLMLVMIIANFCHLVYVTILLKVKLKVRIKFALNYKYLKFILKIALPFALAAGFTRIYGAFDQVLLSKLASNEALGYYAVAYKLTFALQFIPLALVASLYPALSTYYIENKQLLNKAFTRSVYYLLIFTVPMSLGVIALAQEFITNLYTKEYLSSVIILQILIASLTFLFINFPLGSLLNATNRQARNTINIGIATIFNIVLNVILIPKIGAHGAAITSLVSTILLFILGWQAVYKSLTIDYKFIIIVFLKTLFSGLVMFGLILVLKQTLPWMLVAISGFVVYLISQIAIKAIKLRDIRQLYNSFSRKS